MPDRISFTRPAVERIARVVRAVENARPSGGSLTFDRIDSQRKVFRVCTFTGAWSIGSSKTVTFQNVTSTPNTVSAVNLFFPLSAVPPAALTCAIAKDGSQWYLVDVPLALRTGIFVGTTQSGVDVTSTSERSYVTDVQIAASLNTSSCSITVNKTLSTASATFVTGTATSVRVSSTYTASYLALGY
jgi:hypothetical protein